MTWLLRATRVPLLVLGTVVAGAVSGLVRGATAPVPSLSLGAVAPVPVAAVIALLPAVGFVWGWSGLGWDRAAASVRSAWVVAAPALLVCVLPFVLAAGLTGGSGSLLENARNAAGLIGLTLLGAAVLGERGAVLVPIGYLLAAFLVGRGSGQARPWWWAWVLSDGGSAVAGCCALVLLLGGAAVLPRVPRAAVERGER